MSLTALNPKTASFEAILEGGKVVEITLRPFKLSDLAWLQEEFSTEEDQHSILALRCDPLCKIIWHQMDQDSRAFFGDITFTDDEDRKVQVVGYKKLYHSLDSSIEILKGYDAFLKTQNENGFLPDKPVKKKTIFRKILQRILKKS